MLRLQSDERLIAYIRRGSTGAFEVLVARYQARLLAFCRHLLGSKEDAEDVLQEVFAAAFNAILADERPINVRPWLYRIARNRSLNHMRRMHAVGVDSMDVHLSDNGTSTADKVHAREDFRLLVDDIQDLPETQRTALILREMDALSYEQIAEAMETTVPSVKSLLVRARVSLAEAAEARLLSCEEVRVELGEVAEGLRRRPGPLVRRHLRSCKRCSSFKVQLRDTNKALAAMLPLGPLVLLKKLAITHLGHSAGAGAGSSATGAGAATQAAAVGSTAAAGATVSTSAGGIVSAGIGAVASKAAAGLAAAALVTAGAVEVTKTPTPSRRHTASSLQPVQNPTAPLPEQPQALAASAVHRVQPPVKKADPKKAVHRHPAANRPVLVADTKAKSVAKTDPKAKTGAKSPADKTKPDQPASAPGRTQTQTDPTVLTTPMTTTSTTTPTVTTPAPTTVATSPSAMTDPGSTTTSTTPTSTTPTTTTPTTTTTTPTTTTTTTTTPPPPGTLSEPSSDTWTPGACAETSPIGQPSCSPDGTPPRHHRAARRSLIGHRHS